jgi:hypothetical protein
MMVRLEAETCSWDLIHMQLCSNAEFVATAKPLDANVTTEHATIQLTAASGNWLSWAALSGFLNPLHCLVSDVGATWTFPHFSFETAYIECKPTGTAVCLSVASVILKVHTRCWICVRKLDNTKWLDMWSNFHMCPTLSWRAVREIIFFGDQKIKQLIIWCIQICHFCIYCFYLNFGIGLLKTV